MRVRLGRHLPRELLQPLTDVDLSDDELARRAEAYEPPERPFPGVALSKYAKLVSSAAQGAVTF